MKITTFTFLSLFLFSSLKAQCPDGDLLLQNQGQVDQFIIDYPNCENLNSALTIHNSTIGGAYIYNLDGLQNLKSVSGPIDVLLGNYTSNQNINGLRNLEYVGGDFKLTNSNFNSLDNIFSKLETVNGQIIIQNNPSLTFIDDFNSLIHSEDIKISYNESLTNLDGFSAIERVYGHVIMENNGSQVFSVSGINRLKKIDKYLIMTSFSDVNINLNAFNNLEEIGLGLRLIYRSESLDNFTSLKSIGLDAIINIKGFKNPLKLETLNSIGGNLNIAESYLESLWGLQNLTEFDNLSIGSNVSLNFCSLPNICSYLQNGGQAIFSNNAPGCNSVQEVLDNCNMSIDSHELNSKVDIYPNPIKNDLNVSIKDNSLKINKISLYDFGGKLLNEFQSQSKLNLSFYPNGNYVIVLDTDKGFISKKITIAK